VFAVAGVVIKEMIRRKDFYVLFILTVVITLLLGSVTLFNDENIGRYLKEVCLLLIWVSSLVFSVATAGRQIPAERENRTIFPLLAKPVSRAQVLLGKFAGCWFAVGLALLVFYLFFGVITASREHTLPILGYAAALWLHWLMCGVIIAGAMLASLLLTPTAGMTVTFVAVTGILLVAQHLNTVAVHTGGVAGWLLYASYYVLPHLEFYDVRELLIHDLPLSGVFVLTVSLYAVAYAAALLMASVIAFHRKPLN
jgi:ABC-type transport system involved in multi-copper enzyme maturation permease subunit